MADFWDSGVLLWMKCTVYWGCRRLERWKKIAWGASKLRTQSVDCQNCCNIETFSLLSPKSNLNSQKHHTSGDVNHCFPSLVILSQKKRGQKWRCGSQMLSEWRKCDVSVLIWHSRFCLSVCVCVLGPQVANLNPKDNSYSLKDFMYRDVQRDWPGYSEDERSQVDRTLARYLTLHVLLHLLCYFGSLKKSIQQLQRNSHQCMYNNNQGWCAKKQKCFKIICVLLLLLNERGVGGAS